jgi:hypothetical protein
MVMFCLNKNVKKYYSREEDHNSQKVIRLKGAKTNAEDIIPIKKFGFHYQLFG